MCTISASRLRWRERGVSFIELVIFIVIVSIAVTGILLVMNNTTVHSGDPQLRKQALAIAESLLEEIELARFTYCTPSDAQAPFATAATPGGMGPQPPGASAAPGGCTSSSTVQTFGPSGSRPYGNVVNYVTAFNTPTTYSPITDSNGNQITGLTGTYSATVTISQPSVTALGGAANALPNDPGVNPALGSVLQITVSVAQGGNTIVTLDGYRTQYAPQLMP